MLRAAHVTREAQCRQLILTAVRRRHRVPSGKRFGRVRGKAYRYRPSGGNLPGLFRRSITPTTGAWSRGLASMNPSTIYSTCTPRPDVLAGAIESDFAADLALVLRGNAPPEYRDAGRFFQNTYPARGLRTLLSNVCRRPSGAGGEAAAIFRLDTQFGGGKTHGLIALVHAAAGMRGVTNIDEFVDPALLPHAAVRIAAFDGENADPANGRAMGAGIRAFTPWGEIAYALAGPEG